MLGGSSQDQADIEKLTLGVHFECGRCELTVGEIRQFAEGTIVPVARSVQEPVDIIANGVRIGRGALVKVGDLVGVRITWLADLD